jgi:hypothetical protein
MNIIDAYPADITGRLFPVEDGFSFIVEASGQGVKFEAVQWGDSVVKFRLTPLPGNHGILVLNGMLVAEDKKG